MRESTLCWNWYFELKPIQTEKYKNLVQLECGYYGNHTNFNYVYFYSSVTYLVGRSPKLETTKVVEVQNKSHEKIQKKPPSKVSLKFVVNQWSVCSLSSSQRQEVPLQSRGLKNVTLIMHQLKSSTKSKIYISCQTNYRIFYLFLPPWPRVSIPQTPPTLWHHYTRTSVWTNQLELYTYALDTLSMVFYWVPKDTACLTSMSAVFSTRTLQLSKE